MKLLVVAHPDDETLFFGGLLQKSKDWKVILVTDGNADRQGAQRMNQFKKAMHALKVKDFVSLGMPDHYEQRLNIPELVQKIYECIGAKIQKLQKAPREIYTHGIIGEYGHPHHQDVSYAVHTLFKNHPNVFSTAYNAFPEKRIHLSAKEFETKSKILTTTYSSETQRFLNVIPVTSTEGFVRVSPKEVDAIYNYFTQAAGTLNPKHLKTYRPLFSYITSHPPGAVRPRTF